MAEFFPISLRLGGRTCVIVGGGAVALRKARALLKAGARVKVISPRFVKGFTSLRHAELVRGRHAPPHVEGAFVVVAATDSPDLNRRVADDGRARGALVNVVDSPELCDFILPAVVRRGELLLTVSTSGLSPALSRKLRLALGDQYGPEYGKLLRLLAEMRARVKALVEGKEARRRVLRKLVGEDVIGLMKRKGVGAARKEMLRLVSAGIGRASGSKQERSGRRRRSA